MPGVKKTAARARSKLVPRWRLDAGDYIVAGVTAPNGRYCAVGLGNGELTAFDIGTGRELVRQAAHDGCVLSVSIALDSERIASAGQSPHAKVWSATGELLHTLPGGAGWVEHVAWSPAGDLLATASGRVIRFWTRDGELLVETEPLASTVTAIAWSTDGSALAASCYGGVHVLPVTPAGKAHQLVWKGSLISLAWSPDAKVIACGSQDTSVHFWRLATGRDSEMSGYPCKPKALAWDARSSLLATGGDATITLWDFRKRGPEGTRPIQLDAHKGVCTCLGFQPHKATLASGSQDSSVFLWEPRRGTKPLRFGFLEAEITILSWSPDGRVLVAGDADGSVVAWELE